jgi:hypothetical protein
MEILPYLGIMLLTAGSVGIRVAQQLNVTRGYFIRAFFTSYVFTAFDALVVGVYAKLMLDGDYIKLIFAGTGSALGGLIVMFFYRKSK